MSAAYSGSGIWKTLRKIGKSMRTEIAAHAKPTTRPGTSPTSRTFRKKSNDAPTAQATPITVIRLSNSARLLSLPPTRQRKPGTDPTTTPPPPPQPPPPSSPPPPRSSGSASAGILGLPPLLPGPTVLWPRAPLRRGGGPPGEPNPPPPGPRGSRQARAPGARGLCARPPRLEREDGARLHRGAFDFADIGHRIFGEEAKSRVGQIGPPRVADEHVDAGRETAVEEGGHPFGEIALVEEVADRDEIDRRRRTGGEIVADHRDGDTVRCGVEADRGDSVAVDLGRDHLARARPSPRRWRRGPSRRRGRGRGGRSPSPAGRGCGGRAPCRRPTGKPSRAAAGRIRPRSARQAARGRSPDGRCGGGFREAWGPGRRACSPG